MGKYRFEVGFKVNGGLPEKRPCFHAGRGGLFAAPLRLAAAGTSAVNERVAGADNNNGIFYDIIAHSSLFTIILPC